MNKITLDYQDNEELAGLVADLKDGEKVTISGVSAQVIKNANEEIEFRVKSIESVDSEESTEEPMEEDSAEDEVESMYVSEEETEETDDEEEAE
jgi:hypothetical protein